LHLQIGAVLFVVSQKALSVHTHSLLVACLTLVLRASPEQSKQEVVPTVTNPELQAHTPYMKLSPYLV